MAHRWGRAKTSHAPPKRYLFREIFDALQPQRTTAKTIAGTSEHLVSSNPAAANWLSGLRHLTRCPNPPVAVGLSGEASWPDISGLTGYQSADRPRQWKPVGDSAAVDGASVVGGPAVVGGWTAKSFVATKLAAWLV
jgi:hypothetical protein